MEQVELLEQVRLYRVYCYKLNNGKKEKKVWYECEDMKTEEGISWSFDKKICIDKAITKGFKTMNAEQPIIRYYRVKDTP